MENNYSLGDFIRFVLRHYLYGLIPLLVVILLSAVWLVQMPNVYKSEVTLAPTEQAQGNGLAASASQLGGLASLAGISLGGEAVSQVNVAIAIMESRAFAKRIINKYAMAVPLVAATEWDQKDKSLLIDQSIYDSASNQWVREVSAPKTVIPNDTELYEYYIESLHIELLESGLIAVSFTHLSPPHVAQWTRAVIQEVNKEMRTREVAKVSDNIEYLEEQAAKIDSVEIKASIYTLIQEQYEKLMLAEVSDDFIFSVIDPAIEPEFKDGPKRALILVLATIIWSFLLLCMYMIIFMFGNHSN